MFPTRHREEMTLPPGGNDMRSGWFESSEMPGVAVLYESLPLVRAIYKEGVGLQDDRIQADSPKCPLPRIEAVCLKVNSSACSEYQGHIRRGPETDPDVVWVRCGVAE